MSDDWKGSERRDHPRVPMDGSLKGKLESTVEAVLVDLSLSGALLEVASGLPASRRYGLRLPLQSGDSLELLAEVVRSYVHGFDRQPSGKPAVKYRAALQFVELDEAQTKGLESLIEQSAGSRMRAELSS